jgi:oligosaccharyl transferase (archaeosortase A-associated)
MLYIQNLLQNIITAHENIRAKLPLKARFGIIAFLAVISFIILIFQAEWLMANMVALLPVFYVAAVLAVGFKRALYGTAIFLFFCFTLWLRVGPPHQGVLGGSYVLFGENDGWYNMRLVENLVHHFPVRNTFDPYTLYPYGQNIPFAPFFDWFLALIIWIAGLGHPSAALIEKIGAYFPAVLGALTIVPVYFIGKELFNRNAGLLAAGLLAILPGEFLFRSLLGFTDHHAAEALFSTTTMLFFIMAIKRAQSVQPTLSQIKRKEWGNLKKPLLFALLAGFSLGLYILTWIGAAMFIFIILVYIVIQYILDHLNGKSTDYLFIVSIPILLIALLMAAAFHNFLLYSDTSFGGLIIGLLGIAVLQTMSRIMARKNIRRIYYPITTVIIGLLGGGFLYLISPSLFNTILDQIGTLLSSSQTMTIMEAQPLLSGFNVSNLMDHRVWSYFTTGLIMVPFAFLLITYSAIGRGKIGKWVFLGWIGIVVLTVIIDQMTSMPWQIYLVESLAIIALYAYFEKSSAKILLLIWSFITLMALLSQTRYAYYYAINVALLSSYILWKIPSGISFVIKLTGWKEAAAKKDEGKNRAEKKRAKVKEEQPVFKYLRPSYVSGALSIVIIFFLTIYPNLIYGTYDHNGWSPKNSATLFLPYHPYGPNGDWHEALTWMKDNTPDPFGNPDAYYDLYTAPASGESYAYPASAYGVMSWWDYGHWITRMAHRLPNANPFQSGIGGPGPNGSFIPGASIFMTAQDEATASWVMDELDSRYVVIDYETAWPKYHTMITWSGENQSDFYDYWYYDENNYLRTYNNPNPEQSPSAIFFYPAYYQSICARLYNFGTQAVTPSNSSWAISYDVRTDENGEEYKVLTGLANEGQPFATYEQALIFINSNPGYKIVGWPEWIPALNNIFPVRSPIPLEALKEYIKIHSSPSIMPWGDQTTSYVEIFEYTGYKQ